MEIVMSLTGCTEEDAKRVLLECNNDPVDAVDKLLNIPKSRWCPKERVLNESQQKFAEIRKTMEQMDKTIDSGFKKTDQPDCSSSLESSRTHDRHQEPRWSDSPHTQQSHLLIPELEEQTRGTACQ